MTNKALDALLWIKQIIESKEEMVFDTHDLEATYEEIRTALTQPVNKMMLDTLNSIVKKSFLTSTDPVHLATQIIEMSGEAKKAIAAASSAPVVEVEGLEKIIKDAEWSFQTTEGDETFAVKYDVLKALINCARLQLEQQKCGE